MVKPIFEKKTIKFIHAKRNKNNENIKRMSLIFEIPVVLSSPMKRKKKSVKNSTKPVMIWYTKKENSFMYIKSGDA
jgi:hypothetical protein